jgi:hypothetical protein
MPNDIDYLKLSERLDSYADDIDTALKENPDQVETDLKIAAALLYALHQTLTPEQSKALRH